MKDIESLENARKGCGRLLKKGYEKYERLLKSEYTFETVERLYKL